MARDSGGMGTMTSDSAEYGMWGPVDREQAKEERGGYKAGPHVNAELSLAGGGPPIEAPSLPPGPRRK